MTGLTLTATLPKMHSTARQAGPGKLSREIINVTRLSASERDQFLDELGALSGSIIDGLGREYMEADLAADNLVQVKTLMIRDDRGRLVGFNIFRLFENVIDGKIVATFRAAAGILPEYRGRNSVLSFAFAQAIAYKLRHPLRTLNFICFAIHPSSYYLMSRYAHEVWPRHDQETPAETYDFMKKVFAAGGMAIANEQSEYVYSTGKFTNQDVREARFWTTCDKPQVQFYLGLNPHYEKGDGLSCMIPLTAVNILMSGMRFAADKLCRKFSKKN